jgi:hypothetical protein
MILRPEGLFGERELFRSVRRARTKAKPSPDPDLPAAPAPAVDTKGAE